MACPVAGRRSRTPADATAGHVERPSPAARIGAVQHGGCAQRRERTSQQVAALMLTHVLLPPGPLPPTAYADYDRALAALAEYHATTSDDEDAPDEDAESAVAAGYEAPSTERMKAFVRAVLADFPSAVDDDDTASEYEEYDPEYSDEEGGHVSPCYD